METVDETVRFFEGRLFPAPAVAIRAAGGLRGGEREAALRRHLGVCFDACHMAVEFEDAAAGLAALARAAIRVGKVQVSAGLRVQLDPGDRALVDALRPFAEGVYLHQVVERRDGRLTRYLDLPEALEAAARDGGGPREWRVHFHVPLFREELGPFASTQDYLGAVLASSGTRPTRRTSRSRPTRGTSCRRSTGARTSPPPWPGSSAGSWTNSGSGPDFDFRQASARAPASIA